jgi:hypothetical protein
MLYALREWLVTEKGSKRGGEKRSERREKERMLCSF